MNRVIAGVSQSYGVVFTNIMKEKQGFVKRWTEFARSLICQLNNICSHDQKRPSIVSDVSE